MKKFKLAMTLFAVTLCLGGITNAFAAAFLELDGYKADFLQTTPHYSKTVTKTTGSSQKIRIVSTTGGKSILIGEYTGNGEAVSGEFMLFASGSTKNLTSDSYQITGDRKLRFKLSYPWTQVTINGTWYYDMA